MKTLLSLLAGGCLALTLLAADKSADHQLRQFKLGEHLFGPQATQASMHGKAVMLDCWGIHCGPCLAIMPEVENIAKRYQNKLAVVGVHCQENDKQAIEAVVKKNNLSYPIVNNMTSPVQFDGLPHVFLFDAQGEMAFSGSPFDKEFERTLHKIVYSVTPAATPSGLDMLRKPGTPAPQAPL